MYRNPLSAVTHIITMASTAAYATAGKDETYDTIDDPPNMNDYEDNAYLHTSESPTDVNSEYIHTAESPWPSEYQPSQDDDDTTL